MTDTQADVNLLYPRTALVLGYHGIPAHYIPSDNSLHDNGYDSFVMDAASTRILDPSKKVTPGTPLRIRIPWPEDRPEVKTDILAAYAADTAPKVSDFDETPSDYIARFTTAKQAQIAQQAQRAQEAQQ